MTDGLCGEPRTSLGMEWSCPIILEAALRTMGLSVREFLSPRYACDNGNFYEAEWHPDGLTVRAYPYRGSVRVEADLGRNARLVRHGPAIECDDLVLPATLQAALPQPAGRLIDHEFLRDDRIKIMRSMSMAGEGVRGRSDQRTTGVRFRLSMPNVALPWFGPENGRGAK